MSAKMAGFIVLSSSCKSTFRKSIKRARFYFSFSLENTKMPSRFHELLDIDTRLFDVSDIRFHESFDLDIKTFKSDSTSYFDCELYSNTLSTSTLSNIDSNNKQDLNLSSSTTSFNSLKSNASTTSIINWCRKQKLRFKKLRKAF